MNYKETHDLDISPMAPSVCRKCNKSGSMLSKERCPKNETTNKTDFSHYHCFNSKTPPCGQKIEHLKCCICEMLNPIIFRGYKKSGSLNKIDWKKDMSGKVGIFKCKGEADVFLSRLDTFNFIEELLDTQVKEIEEQVLGVVSEEPADYNSNEKKCFWRGVEQTLSNLRALFSSLKKSL